MRLEGKKPGGVYSNALIITQLAAATKDRRAHEQVASERTTLMIAKRRDCILLG